MINMFEKRNVVMLPTNKKANIKLGCNNLLISNFNGYEAEFTNQHIYITSNETPEEGDWCVDTYYNTIIRFGIDNKGLSCEKIIATTDTSLFYTEQGILNHFTREQDVLPKLPQSFIEKYISEYNIGNVITEIMVEYSCNLSKKEDNTINIKPIKDSWSREEVDQEKDEFIHLFFSMHYDKLSNAGITSQTIREWIKENL